MQKNWLVINVNKKYYCSSKFRNKANRKRKILNDYLKSSKWKEYKDLAHFIKVFMNILGNKKRIADY